MTTACAMALGLILVAPVAAQSAHPRIFITADDVPRLRAMADDNQTNALGFAPAEEWLTIKAQADTFANADPYHYGVDMPGKNGGPKQRFEYTLSDAPPPRHDEFSH